MFIQCTSVAPANNFYLFFFFFNDTATTEIYTLSLHDALPICPRNTSAYRRPPCKWPARPFHPVRCARPRCRRDRKSTRLNSSHGYISYAVFCLKKKKAEILIIAAHHRARSLANVAYVSTVLIR